MTPYVKAADALFNIMQKHPEMMKTPEQQQALFVELYEAYQKYEKLAEEEAKE